MNVEQTILNIDADLTALEDELHSGGATDIGEILGNAQDFFGFLTDMAIGATLAGYFTSNGLKDTKLLDDLVDNADNYDWTGEDPEETEDN